MTATRKTATRTARPLPPAMPDARRIEEIAASYGVELDDIAELPSDGWLREELHHFLNRVAARAGRDIRLACASLGRLLQATNEEQRAKGIAPSFNMERSLEGLELISIVLRNALTLRLGGLVRSNDSVRADYEGRSSTNGIRITLGVYDDEEQRIASFFHELGHCLAWRSRTHVPATPYDDEVQAWMLGLSLAQKEGFRFSPATIAWCDEQLATYYTPEGLAPASAREPLPAVTEPAPPLIARRFG